MSRALTFGLLIALAAGLVLRCPQLDIRPMHNDEAVNAIKLKALWERGAYQYDPQEYHGPTLLYLTLAWMKLTGPANFAQFSETQLRMVTVLFGAGLILLLPLVADGLGRRATVCAGLLTAISPAMVFYSRYFIHEMLLVFFTFLALAAGWRYWRSRKVAWALLAGAAVGLMQATKETFVLTLAAMAAACLLVRCCKRTEEPQPAKFRYDLNHVAMGLSAWLATVVVLFTSFFTNLRGLADSVRTYLPWLHRAGGASPHIHPWNFYLERLAYYHLGKGPVWSEGLILGLAVVGIIAAFMGGKLVEGDRGFLRYLAVYTIVLTAIYCAIGYKTPWCLLSFWHGMILLAGVGTMTLIEWPPQRAMKIAVAVLLLAGGGQLATQAWQSSLIYAADAGNPYAYAQTSEDLLNLIERVDAVAQASPDKYDTVIKVMAPDGEYWPLPWYLRRFKQVGWWQEMPPDSYAPMMIVSTKFQANLDERKTHLMVGIFESRPQVFFELYVETNLWNAHLKASTPAR